jgi:hypothetical protein
MNKENSEERILDGICIAMPCSVGWDEMKGDNKVRLCGGCNKNVYNISEMSKKEAEEVLSAPTLPCIQIARTSDGAIVTNEGTIGAKECATGIEEKSNVIHGFWSYGKSAVSAILSLIATFTPQLASAADEKTKPIMTRGKPAVIAPKLHPQQVTPALPGMPVFIPKSPAQSIWPSSISGLGFSKEDLPLAISDKFTAEQINSIDSKKVDLGTVPKQLDKAAWELFFKARKLHLKAAMRLVNKDIDKSLQDCQESQKLYQLALEQIARGRHDEAFAALVYQEQNKTKLLDQQARKCLNPAPTEK